MGLLRGPYHLHLLFRLCTMNIDRKNCHLRLGHTTRALLLPQSHHHLESLPHASPDLELRALLNHHLGQPIIWFRPRATSRPATTVPFVFHPPMNFMPSKLDPMRVIPDPAAPASLASVPVAITGTLTILEEFPGSHLLEPQRGYRNMIW